MFDKNYCEYDVIIKLFLGKVRKNKLAGVLQETPGYNYKIECTKAEYARLLELKEQARRELRMPDNATGFDDWRLA